MLQLLQSLVLDAHQGLRLSIDELQTPIEIGRDPLPRLSIAIVVYDLVDDGSLLAHDGGNIDEERREGFLGGRDKGELGRQDPISPRQDSLLGCYSPTATWLTLAAARPGIFALIKCWM